MKKILTIAILLFQPLLVSSCLNKDVEPFNNVYGMDVYDVMELNDTVILELEITGISKSTFGYSFKALDSNGVSTTDKSEEILGSPMNEIFYSLPNGFGKELVINETYYITFTKKLNIPNTFPQFGLLGDNTDLSDNNFNYDGYYCNVNDISNCYKVPATTYDFNDNLLSYEEIVSSASNIASVVDTEGYIVDVSYDSENNVDEDGHPYNSNILIKDKETYLTLLNNIRYNPNHNTKSAELIIDNRYIIKFVIRSEVTSGTGTELDPYVIDADIARITERLQ